MYFQSTLVCDKVFADMCDGPHGRLLHVQKSCVVESSAKQNEAAVSSSYSGTTGVRRFSMACELIFLHFKMFSFCVGLEKGP